MKRNGGNGKLINAMNDALNREISTAVRYLVQSSRIQGRQNEPLRQMYRREVSEELGHAQYLADKIVMLGGKPELHPDLALPPEDISQMIARDLRAEHDDIANYKRLAQMADDAGDIELKLQMENQAADESRHAEELLRMRG
jgi:bacterioferritin